MLNKFNKVYLEIINEMNNNLIKEDQNISFAHDKDDEEKSKDGITNDVLTDKRVKLLKKWGVYIPQKINPKKTDLNKMLKINNIRYSSIYNEILTYRAFQKLYPGIDKTTCKLYSFSHNSQESVEAVKKAQKNPSFFKKIINSITSIGEKDPNKCDVNCDFVSCYITQDGTILKPNNVDDTAYLNACKLIAGIVSLDPDSNEIGNLKTINGKDISTLVQKQVKKIQSDEKLKEKYQKYVEKNFSKWICSNETTAWGKQQLQKLIQIGNEKAKSGDKSFKSYPDFHYLGISISSGSYSNQKIFS